MNQAIADNANHHISYQNGSFNSPNAEAGPSSLHRQPAAQYELDPKSQKLRDPPKKKKATRACFHCQKAHLTCDDARPCQRCIKRGCADTCIEGHRKKAKYLLDEEELESLKSQSPRKTIPIDLSPQVVNSSTEPYPASILSAGDGTFNPSLDPVYAFGSEGANLEYSMISQLLGSDQRSPALTQTDPDSRNGYWQTSTGSTNQEMQSFPSASEAPTSPEQFRFPQQSNSNQYPFPSPLIPSGPSPMPQFLRTQSSGSQPYSSSPISIDQSPRNMSDGANFTSNLLHMAPAQRQPPLDFHRGPPLPSRAETPMELMELETPADVYFRVTAPYDYTSGYHYLMRYLQNGTFDKNDILRVVRALAIFRPSLIALQMPLSGEDEIFVEKCFQRSLLELDKLISMSGTPTVVWRRTGEICLVGLEFSLLTEWPQRELLGGRRFIYELFETQSTIEYWENFANHAFENTMQSVHSHCVLVKPSGQHIPCTFCFSIRRDLFDLPHVVIGQWLPML